MEALATLPATMEERLFSSPSLRLCVVVLAVTTVTACSGGTTGASTTERPNSVLCLDALALPVTSATQLLLAADRLPQLRSQAYEILEFTAPDPEVTEGAHAVALKTVAVIDAAESLLADSEDPLGLLSSGLSGLAELSGPLQDLMTAQMALTDSCLRVVGPSGVPTPRSEQPNAEFL